MRLLFVLGMLLFLVLGLFLLRFVARELVVWSRSWWAKRNPPDIKVIHKASLGRNIHAIRAAGHWSVKRCWVGISDFSDSVEVWQSTDTSPGPLGCEKACAGWQCAREAGHDGPCAAEPAPPITIIEVSWEQVSLGWDNVPVMLWLEPEGEQ